VFAGLAIFVACLGLYALAAFTAEQRTNEMHPQSLVRLCHCGWHALTRFMILVTIAFVIGIPVGIT
jgi:putative ABC transport system permease protein